MITVLPSEDENMRRTLEQKAYMNTTGGFDFTLFTVKIDDKVVGYVAVDIFDIYSRLHYIKILSQDMKNIILDYMIRTIMSYSLNRNIFTVMCECKEYFDDLKGCLFHEKDDIIYLEIYKHMGCNGKH